METNLTTDINLRLVSVSELDGATAINRRAARRLGRKPVQVDMNVRVVPKLESNLITLIVSTSYIGIVNLIRERLLVCSAVATFEVQDLQKHVEQNGEDIIVGSKLMMTMLGIAVGALRGIIAVRTKFTPLEHCPLPVIDLSALMYRLRYGQPPPRKISRL